MSTHQSTSLPPPRQGTIHDLLHNLLPTFFFLHFLITLAVLLVYALNGSPVPRPFALGTLTAFGTLCGLYMLIFLLRYTRMKLAARYGLAVSKDGTVWSRPGTQGSHSSGEQGGVDWHIIWASLKRRLQRWQENSYAFEEWKQQRMKRARRSRGQFGGLIPMNQAFGEQSDLEQGYQYDDERHNMRGYGNSARISNGSRLDRYFGPEDFRYGTSRFHELDMDGQPSQHPSHPPATFRCPEDQTAGREQTEAEMVDYGHRSDQSPWQSDHSYHPAPAASMASRQNTHARKKTPERPMTRWQRFFSKPAPQPKQVPVQEPGGKAKTPDPPLKAGYNENNLPPTPESLPRLSPTACIRPAGKNSESTLNATDTKRQKNVKYGVWRSVPRNGGFRFKHHSLPYPLHIQRTLNFQPKPVPVRGPLMTGALLSGHFGGSRRNRVEINYVQHLKDSDAASLVFNSTMTEPATPTQLLALSHPAPSTRPAQPSLAQPSLAKTQSQPAAPPEVPPKVPLSAVGSPMRDGVAMKAREREKDRALGRPTRLPRAKKRNGRVVSVMTAKAKKPLAAYVEDDEM